MAEKNRFWANGSDSDSDSVEDEDIDTDVKTNVAKMNKWVVESDSDSDDDKGRVVRSAKEKHMDALEDHITTVRNGLKNNDWDRVQEGYKSLNEAVEKVRKATGISFPVSFVRTIVAIDTAVEGVTKEDTRKMTKSGARAYTTLKQAMKKTTKVEPLLGEIEKYKKNPVVSDDEDEEDEEEEEDDDEEDDDDDDEDDDEDEEEEEEEEDDDEDDDDEDSEEEVKIPTKAVTKAPAKAPTTKKKVDDDDDDDDSDEGMWAGDSDSSSSEDDGELKGRARWVLRKVEVKEKKKEVVGQTPEEILEEERRRKEEEELKLQAQLLEIERKRKEDLIDTPEKLVKKLVSVTSQRGRKGFNIKMMLESLRALETVAVTFGSSWYLPTIFQLVAAQLEYNRDADSHLPIDIWMTAFNDMQAIISTLEGDLNLVLATYTSDEATSLALGTYDIKSAVELPHETKLREEKGTVTVRVIGKLSSFVSSLATDYSKGLRSLDAHSVEYIQRLAVETQLVSLCSRIQAYYERTGGVEDAATIALLRIEHTYYKHDPSDDGSVIQVLCKMVYKYGDERSKTRAILCHIFHHSLHDRFNDARDLMLMSRLQDNIHLTDIPTQVLFNRAMVQLGLAAFRAGHLEESHNCLAEICASRTRQLLAQGVSRFQNVDKSTEEQTRENRRQMPYHMHINLDLIEACHLISAMLLEVPNMAAQEFDVRRRPLSKNFRNALDRYERQVFTGPPEGTKDFILAAAKYLEDGEWKKSAEFIVGLKVWKLWEGVPNRSDKVKSVILDKLKEAAVRTYMFTFCSYYSSISLQKLSEMFELPTNRIHRIISKMMISKELKASWDQTTGSILVHREDPTRLQKYAMVFAERLSHFVESNERLMDVKCGVLNEDSGRGGGVRREEHYSAPRSFGRKTTRRYGGEGGGGGGRNYYRQ